MKQLTLNDAKAALSALIDDAIAGEPTVIIREQRKEAILVSFTEWERIAVVPGFAELLLAFPGVPADILGRIREPARTLRDTD